MKLTCADPTCERTPMRTRDEQRWCMYHPGQTAPDIDLLSGRLRGADGKPKKDAPLAQDVLRPSSQPAVRRSARATAPTTPRAPRVTPQPPADGRCPIAACPLAYRHRGRHSAGLDAPEAARRYQGGEGLFALAAALHVGANTLRAALACEGVTLRDRGQVIGDRGAPLNPLDPAEVRRLYAAGHTTTAIARSLRVKNTRVADVLRAHGELRAAGQAGPRAAPLTPTTQAPRTTRHRPTGICPTPLCGKAAGHVGTHHTGCTEQVVTKLTPADAHTMRTRAADLDQSVSEYLRSLIHADLTAQGRHEQAS